MKTITLGFFLSIISFSMLRDVWVIILFLWKIMLCRGLIRQLRLLNLSGLLRKYLKWKMGNMGLKRCRLLLGDVLWIQLGLLTFICKLFMERMFQLKSWPLDLLEMTSKANGSKKHFYKKMLVLVCLNVTNPLDNALWQ